MADFIYYNTCTRPAISEQDSVPFPYVQRPVRSFRMGTPLGGNSTSSRIIGMPMKERRRKMLLDGMMMSSTVEAVC